ncbi:MAG: ATP-binding protein [Myxococcota bacterium]|nr:ATP-binding protein [Myxococcota bacterium]
MRLRTKLVVIIVFVAIVPLAISAYSTLGVHQRAFDEKVKEIRSMTAGAGAKLLQAQLDTYRETLTQAIQTISWGELTDEEKDGALWLIYQQLNEIAVVTLLDQTGQGLRPSVYLDSASSVKKLNKHSTVNLLTLKAFANKIPFDDAKKHGIGVGDIFTPSPDILPILPMAFSVAGQDQSSPWVVSVGISMGQVCKELRENTSDASGLTVMLVDPLKRVVCGSGNATPLKPIHEHLKVGISGGQPVELKYENHQGTMLLATVAPMPNDWAVIAEQAAQEAFTSSNKMRLQTLFWLVISVIVAATSGLLLGRSITIPIKNLVHSASEFAKGNFNYRLKAEGRDELAALSGTFNRMGEEIGQRDAEIRQWNQELQQRVEEQTLELREVQEQLVHSQKIAAVTSLGAGIAHEINNPLTGILGFIQLMINMAQKDQSLDEYTDMLRHVEKHSLRIKDIVGRVLKFSQTYKGKDFTEIDLSDLIEKIALDFDEVFSKQDIQLRIEFEAATRHLMGVPSDLHEVFEALIKNACNAMPDGGTISMQTSIVEDQVIKIAISDTGKGIAKENLNRIFDPFFTTKDNWTGEGLGLTLATRTVESHHGKIKAHSVLGKGTTMTIYLPSARAEAHLK